VYFPKGNTSVSNLKEVVLIEYEHKVAATEFRNKAAKKLGFNVAIKDNQSYCMKRCLQKIAVPNGYANPSLSLPKNIVQRYGLIPVYNTKRDKQMLRAYARTLESIQVTIGQLEQTGSLNRKAIKTILKCCWSLASDTNASISMKWGKQSDFQKTLCYCIRWLRKRLQNEP